ncbi:MAG: primosomal protein N' [Gammaproteobacteria bacterium]|nr:primosomal protein N' [Gammaproteobacteria bacterium]
MSSEPILRIALPGPLRLLFDYLPPHDHDLIPLPGTRLAVPFGRTKRCGVLIEIVPRSQLPAERLKRATAILDSSPLFTAADLKFLHWASHYYQHPFGDVIFHALPVRLRKPLPAKQVLPTAWRLTPKGRSIDPTTLSRAPRQAAILRSLQTHPAGQLESELFERCGNCKTVLRNLQQKTWIESLRTESPQAKRQQSSSAHELNQDQALAVKQTRRFLGQFKAVLLEGVTGSGKTEVYLHLLEQTLDTHGQVLVLVPEIGLTPQLVRRFERRLGRPVTLLHSNLSQGEREQAWLAANRGSAQILVGTRSAIFTPIPNLQLIILDEEHDISFKQQEGFRYSARDLAIVRAQRQPCPVLLGSATPSLESLHNAQQGRYLHLHLPERVGSAVPPRISLLDIRSSRLDGGLSPALLKQVRATLQRQEQVILFLNRRGYAPVITCHACGWLADCPRCDARMTLHLKSHLLWCHHCGHQHATPERCPSCESPDLRPLGQGTERLEGVLNQHFPDIPVARIDRDTTSRKGSLEKLLKAIAADDFPIILGTQMLAKGHHFPNVTLVGLIDVDQGLFGADYRAPERMAQLITQVAGRAGRADKPGHVLIQTRHPDHPLLTALVQEGYPAFARDALLERRQAQLPPYSYQVLLRAESTKSDDPTAFLEHASAAGQQITPAGALDFWGPVPAPMERRAGKFHAHLLVQSPDRATLQRWLKHWVERLSELPSAKRVRWSLDVDPQEML